MAQKIIHSGDMFGLDEILTGAGYYTMDIDEHGHEVRTGYLPVEATGLSIEKENDGLIEGLICVLITPQQEPVINDIYTLTILGTYDEIFADPEKLKIYDRIYDRSPQTWKDPETGEQITTTPPDHFAEFSLPEPDPDEDAKKKEAQRQKMLDETVDVVQTHNEQKELGVKTDITDQQYKETLAFRESLRKM